MSETKENQRRPTEGDPVCFHHEDGEFAALSNFYPFSNNQKHDFVMFTKASNGQFLKFNSSAQYFHFGQFCAGPGTTEASHEFAEVIRAASTAEKAATLGSQPTSRCKMNEKVCPDSDDRTLEQVLDMYTREVAPARTDWDDVRLVVMQKALLCKFMQNRDLRKLLLSTGDRPIFECSPTDAFWGIGSGGGENHMGRLLEDVRFFLQSANL